MAFVEVSAAPLETINGILSDRDIVPIVAVTMTVLFPTVASEEALNVIVVVPPVVGPKLAETPAGNPDAVKVGKPVNPFTRLVDNESVMVLPCSKASCAGIAISEKLGLFVTVRSSCTDADVIMIALIVTVLEPAAVPNPAEKVHKRVLLSSLVSQFAVTPLGKPLILMIVAILADPESVASAVSPSPLFKVRLVGDIVNVSAA